MIPHYPRPSSDNNQVTAPVYADQWQRGMLSDLNKLMLLTNGKTYVEGMNRGQLAEARSWVRNLAYAAGAVTTAQGSEQMIRGLMYISGQNNYQSATVNQLAGRVMPMATLNNCVQHMQFWHQLGVVTKQEADDAFEYRNRLNDRYNLLAKHRSRTAFDEDWGPGDQYLTAADTGAQWYESMGMLIAPLAATLIMYANANANRQAPNVGGGPLLLGPAAFVANMLPAQQQAFAPGMAGQFNDITWSMFNLVRNHWQKIGIAQAIKMGWKEWNGARPPPEERTHPDPRMNVAPYKYMVEHSDHVYHRKKLFIHENFPDKAFTVEEFMQVPWYLGGGQLAQSVVPEVIWSIAPRYTPGYQDKFMPQLAPYPKDVDATQREDLLNTLLTAFDMGPTHWNKKRKFGPEEPPPSEPQKPEEPEEPEKPEEPEEPELDPWDDPDYQGF